ncbi:MAG: hypothetical protein WCV99_18075 [Sterolibacterium sp.]
MSKSPWLLYEYQPAFVIGFHGCDAVIGEGILAGTIKHLDPSRKKWDWLGHGLYFWEGNPQRALEWARERAITGSITTPFVLGAIIDLKHCLDLLDSSGLQLVQDAHATLAASYAAVGIPLPRNRVGKDKAARTLDCLVINSLHKFITKRRLPRYQSVRAMFPEGDELYHDAGFKDKNHIQLCIRDNTCIKGYFRPIMNGLAS